MRCYIFTATFVCVALLATVNGVDVNVPKGDESIDVAKHKTTTTEPATTTTTEVPSSTAPAPKTTSTLPPKTTSTLPPKTTPTTTPATTTTTTVAPNVTTHAPNVTTPAPVTTSTSNPITTTVAPPKPPVDPSTGTWTVNYTDTKNMCIHAKMAIQIEIPYNTTRNTTGKAYVDIPADANATGVCGNDKQILELQWNNKTNFASFNFKKLETGFDLELINVSITPDANNFPGIDSLKVLFNLVHKKETFNTTDKKSYKCDKVQTLNLTNPDSVNSTARFYVSHVQLQAFVNTTSNTFMEAEDCEPFTTADIVPIAAGCALAVLIIIVVAGYLIGRRRSQARGYLSIS